MTRPQAETIISLSSIPPRLPHIGPVLESLLSQDLAPAEIRLCIPRSYRRFPEWDGCLPDLPPGIRLIRCEEDFGPATKILPTLAALGQDGLPVLFCDDDSIFAPHWHRAFVESAAAHPGMVIAGQAMEIRSIPAAMRPPARLPRFQPWEADALSRHLSGLAPPLPAAPPVTRASGFADIFLGRAGVWLRPEMQLPDVFDMPEILWGHDDLWLSAQAEANDVPIWCEATVPNPASIPCLRLMRPLFAESIAGRSRSDMHRDGIALMRRSLGIWLAEPPAGEIITL